MPNRTVENFRICREKQSEFEVGLRDISNPKLYKTLENPKIF